DSAVILLIQAVGHQGMQAHAVRVVAVLGVRGWNEVCPNAAVVWTPTRACVARLGHAAARPADVEVGSITLIDAGRMGFCPAMRLVLIAAAPCLALRVLVEAVDAAPCTTSVVGAKQPLGRGPCVPCARL